MGVSYSMTDVCGASLTSRIILSSHVKDYFWGIEINLTDNSRKENSFFLWQSYKMLMKLKNNGYILKTFFGYPNCTGPSSLPPYFYTVPLKYYQNYNCLFV